MQEIPSRYNPKEAQDKWYKFWEENGYFSAQANPSKKPFSIVIPPPNVTGILHMGHALNNTIQDILIRYHRMRGEESLWMPGTDHAGIATQNVVEKSLAKEGRKREDLGREKFVERVWEWKEEYGATIIQQLKKIGASCDWGRIRFTMDQEYSLAVKTVFVKLWDKGLIYQDNKVINWCPRCQTALSDEEAPHHQMQGSLYYMRYPLKSNPRNFVVVATTRPETMLGDTAVAVNPKDKRYKKLIGERLILPLTDRQIEIISDGMVEAKFGTGAVKVTPAHDPNDYILGKKHNLEFINVMHPDGRMNDHAGDYAGMDRFEARQVILEDLKEKGLLEKVEPHDISAGHCYRCHTVIEPYLSRQWFVKMAPLAIPAISAVKKGKIKFYPERWTKVYLNWMENIQDWCISRQIWWGHRIPLWYCNDCGKLAIAALTKPSVCGVCKSSNLKQEEDVLDTWFSSWLWPFATFGWPFSSEDAAKNSQDKEDLKYFYPGSTLVTAPEIIFFWVARMIMAGFEFMGDLPFRDVYIHGTVRDIEGKKMSKSLGNIIDPVEIVNEYGADALRFSLISITAQGQDVFLSKEKFEQGRNFANKIWNASRFILMNLDPANARGDLCVFFKKEQLHLVDRWILSRFFSTLKQVDDYLDNYRFNEAVNSLYGFFWREFCDWYLELIKPNIKNKQHQLVMYKILEKFLRIAHPFMPFVTEEIWHLIQQTNKPANEQTSIMNTKLPHLQKQIIDRKSEEEMERIFELISTIRNIRAELEIPPAQLVSATIYTAKIESQDLFKLSSPHIKYLGRLETLEFAKSYRQSPGKFATVFKDMHIVIPLEGLIDVRRHKEKITKKMEKTASEIKAKKKMLANKSFIERAPEEVTRREEEKLKELTLNLKKLKGVKDGLS